MGGKGVGCKRKRLVSKGRGGVMGIWSKAFKGLEKFIVGGWWDYLVVKKVIIVSVHVL